MCGTLGLAVACGTPALHTVMTGCPFARVFLAQPCPLFSRKIDEVSNGASLSLQTSQASVCAFVSAAQYLGLVSRKHKKGLGGAAKSSHGGRI